MSKTFSVGRVTVLHKGEWDESTTYSRLDIVTHDGSSYFVLADVTGVEPPDDTYYAVVAEKGDAGSSIKSIEQTVQSSSSSGENVLTITLDDGTASTVIITNGEQGETGNGIESAEQTTESDESGGKNVLTITMTDGSTATLTVTNGGKGDTGTGISGIERTGGDGSAGTTDTYTITLTNEKTYEFEVYNGADGDVTPDELETAKQEATKYYYVIDETNDITYRCYDAIVDGNPVTYYEDYTEE